MLTTGLVVSAVLAWVFGAILEDVTSRDPITAFDRVVAQTLHTHAVPWLTRIFVVVTTFGSGWVLVPAAAVLAAALSWRRRWAGWARSDIGHSGGGGVERGAQTCDPSSEARVPGTTRARRGLFLPERPRCILRCLLRDVGVARGWLGASLGDPGVRSLSVVFVVAVVGVSRRLTSACTT